RLLETPPPASFESRPRPLSLRPDWIDVGLAPGLASGNFCRVANALRHRASRCRWKPCGDRLRAEIHLQDLKTQSRGCSQEPASIAPPNLRGVSRSRRNSLCNGGSVRVHRPPRIGGKSAGSVNIIAPL